MCTVPVLALGCALCVVLVASADRSAVPTTLDLRLMAQVTGDLTQNQAISPFLMSSLLTQLWLGARGSSRTQLGQAIGVSKTNKKMALLSYRSATRQLLRGSTDVTTAVFNRLYVRSAFRIKLRYQAQLKWYFMKQPKFFSSPEQGASAINKAVADATKNRISDLVSPNALRDIQLILVSALYFKGKWLTKFEVAPPSPFLTLSGDKPVTKMILKQDMLYRSFMQFDVISLPYQDPQYSLLVLRPKARTMAAVKGLRNVLHNLDIGRVYSSLKKREVKVTMPRFKIEKEYSMQDHLKALGVHDIFSNGRADLSGISNKPLFVSSVIMKVFMEVNEEGTEAAAAGAVFVSFRSLQPPSYVDFNCDRPFFTVLYNSQQKINLFTAFVAQPKP